MSGILIGVFLVMHGLVHLFYFALSRRFFELDKPIVGFPEKSWLFSGFMPEATVCSMASVLYMVATLAFVVGGLGFLFDADWYPPALSAAAVISSLTVFLFWDGKAQKLAEKGFIGILINAVVVVAVLAA